MRSMFLVLHRQSTVNGPTASKCPSFSLSSATLLLSSHGQMSTNMPVRYISIVLHSLIFNSIFPHENPSLKVQVFALYCLGEGTRAHQEKVFTLRNTKRFRYSVERIWSGQLPLPDRLTVVSYGCFFTYQVVLNQSWCCASYAFSLISCLILKHNIATGVVHVNDERDLGTPSRLFHGQFFHGWPFCIIYSG